MIRAVCTVLKSEESRVRHVLVNLNFSGRGMTLALDNSILILDLHADRKQVM